MRDQATAEAYLAQRLGMQLDEFVELFGAGWREAEPFRHQLLSGDDWGEWYVAADPPQIMLALTADDRVRLARPRGVWQGVAELSLQPVDERTVPRGLEATDEVRSIVADLLRRRRSTFRYCRYCRDLTPPEYWEEGACMSCSERWLGVVH